MKPESFVWAVAGILFGIIVGWVIGSQQAAGSRAGAPAVPQQTTGTAQTEAAQPPPPVLDQARVQALKTLAEQNPKDVQPRIELGNLYFDSEHYPEAITWYEQAFALDPTDPNVSTDLGVAYYYTNQPDRAIAQFEKSLAADPKHTKTLLNMGIVKAFGKQDLQGAAEAWERVVAIAPESPEGQRAKQALDGLRNAHPPTGSGSGGQ